MKRTLEQWTNKMPLVIQFEQKIPNTCKFSSWNVSGFNACLKKGFVDYMEAEDADIMILQEMKLQSDPNIDIKRYPYHTQKKGYSGTALLSKIKPLSIQYKIGDEQLDHEGRYIIAEFKHYILVACYIINAGEGLKRLDLKMEHLKKLEAFFKTLKKPVIWGGDLNVAHTEIDLARPKTNEKTPGFTPQERQAFSRMLENLDLIDTFRYLHPEAIGQETYTYFSYRFQARLKGIGWRLDYFVVSKSLIPLVKDVQVRSEIYGASDHCPLVLQLLHKED